MAKRWWTADLHLGHANINKYCNRPWFDATKHLDAEGQWVSAEVRDAVLHRANSALIHNIRSRVKPDDQVIHVGDFCCKGNDRGVPGVRTKAQSWMDQMPGHWVCVTGNHDANNGLKHTMDTATATVGRYNVFVQHRPVEHIGDMPHNCHFMVCGHVHEKWSERYLDGVWEINVGVDVRRFMPIDDNELLAIYARCLRREPDDYDRTETAAQAVS